MTSDELAVLAKEAFGSMDRLRSAFAECGQAASSRALTFALAAGLPPQATYSVNETATYLGVDRAVLYQEIRAGRLRALSLDGRNKRLSCDEVDRWLEENTR